MGKLVEQGLRRSLLRADPNLVEPKTYGEIFESLKMPQRFTELPEGKPDRWIPGIYGPHAWPAWADTKSIFPCDEPIVSGERMLTLFRAHVGPRIGDKPVVQLRESLAELARALRRIVDAGRILRAEAVETWNVMSEMAMASGLGKSVISKIEPPVGWVYLVRSKCNGVKIGWTGGHPLERVEGLETGCPSDLVIESIFRGTRGDERAIHHRFRRIRRHLEWFEASEELLNYAAEVRGARIAEAVHFVEGRGGNHQTTVVLLCLMADMSLWSAPRVIERFAAMTQGDLDGAFRPGADSERFSQLGRNVPCPCGSGRKLKRCCGGPARRAVTA